jgi:hypothetical protein
MPRRFQVSMCFPFADPFREDGGDWMPLGKFGSFKKALQLTEAIEATDPRCHPKLPMDKRHYLLIEEISETKTVS